MEKNSTTKLIIGFLVLIVGIALIGSIANSTNSLTDLDSVSNETISIASDRTVAGDCPMGVNGTNVLTIANAPSGWKQDGCPISSFVLYNQTGVVTTSTTDYTFFTNNGTFFLKNTTLWGNCANTINDTYVSYTYCPDDYMNIAWGRTLLDLISGFFALALLGVSVGIFYSVAKDEKILN